MNRILDKYNELCNTPSDINELLPYLKEIAGKVSHITEMGVRRPTSTYALLAGNPKKLVSYDIGRYPEVDLVEELAKEAGIDFQFVLQNVLEADIEPTDFLWIDTYHSENQLLRELERHSSKASKYIGFHDTETYKIFSEPPYEGILPEVAGGRGLWFAIEAFLAKGGWKILLQLTKNNGLTIIERI